MHPHLRYLWYVLRHKWYVFYAGVRLGGIPLWRLLIHDWTKFTRAEWSAYVHTFYAADGSKQYKPTPAFNDAWEHHYTHNPHHWNYWLVADGAGGMSANWMMKTYAREMVADWYGAGMVINGKPEVETWYLANKDKMQIHDSTRFYVTQVIKEAKRKGIIP